NTLLWQGEDESNIVDLIKKAVLYCSQVKAIAPELFDGLVSGVGRAIEREIDGLGEFLYRGIDGQDIWDELKQAVRKISLKKEDIVVVDSRSLQNVQKQISLFLDKTFLYWMVLFDTVVEGNHHFCREYLKHIFEKVMGENVMMSIPTRFRDRTVQEAYLLSKTYGIDEVSPPFGKNSLKLWECGIECMTSLFSKELLKDPTNQDILRKAIIFYVEIANFYKARRCAEALSILIEKSGLVRQYDYLCGEVGWLELSCRKAYEEKIRMLLGKFPLAFFDFLEPGGFFYEDLPWDMAEAEMQRRLEVGEVEKIDEKIIIRFTQKKEFMEWLNHRPSKLSFEEEEAYRLSRQYGISTVEVFPNNLWRCLIRYIVSIMRRQIITDPGTLLPVKQLAVFCKQVGWFDLAELYDTKSEIAMHSIERDANVGWQIPLGEKENRGRVWDLELRKFSIKNKLANSPLLSFASSSAPVLDELEEIKRSLERIRKLFEKMLKEQDGWQGEMKVILTEQKRTKELLENIKKVREGGEDEEIVSGIKELGTALTELFQECFWTVIESRDRESLRLIKDEMIPVIQRGIFRICLESAHGYFYREDLDSMFRLIKMAVEINPEEKRLLVDFAVGYSEQDKLPQAIDILQKTVVLYPDYQPAYYFLGVFFSKQGSETPTAKDRNDSFQQAVEYFIEAINLNPSCIGSQVGIGNAYISLGQLNRAAERFDDAWRCYEKMLSNKDTQTIASVRSLLGGGYSFLTEVYSIRLDGLLKEGKKDAVDKLILYCSRVGELLPMLSNSLLFGLLENIKNEEARQKIKSWHSKRQKEIAEEFPMREITGELPMVTLLNPATGDRILFPIKQRPTEGLDYPEFDSSYYCEEEMPEEMPMEKLFKLFKRLYYLDDVASKVSEEEKIRLFLDPYATLIILYGFYGLDKILEYFLMEEESGFYSIGVKDHISDKYKKIIKNIMSSIDIKFGRYLISDKACDMEVTSMCRESQIEFLKWYDYSPDSLIEERIFEMFEVQSVDCSELTALAGVKNNDFFIPPTGQLIRENHLKDFRRVLSIIPGQLSEELEAAYKFAQDNRIRNIEIFKDPWLQRLLRCTVNALLRLISIQLIRTSKDRDCLYRDTKDDIQWLRKAVVLLIVSGRFHEAQECLQLAEQLQSGQKPFFISKDCKSEYMHSPLCSDSRDNHISQIKPEAKFLASPACAPPVSFHFLENREASSCLVSIIKKVSLTLFRVAFHNVVIIPFSVAFSVAAFELLKILNFRSVILRLPGGWRYAVIVAILLCISFLISDYFHLWIDSRIAFLEKYTYNLLFCVLIIASVYYHHVYFKYKYMLWDRKELEISLDSNHKVVIYGMPGPDSRGLSDLERSFKALPLGAFKNTEEVFYYPFPPESFLLEGVRFPSWVIVVPGRLPYKAKPSPNSLKREFSRVRWEVVSVAGRRLYEELPDEDRSEWVGLFRQCLAKNINWAQNPEEEFLRWFRVATYESFDYLKMAKIRVLDRVEWEMVLFIFSRLFVEEIQGKKFIKLNSPAWKGPRFVPLSEWGIEMRLLLEETGRKDVFRRESSPLSMVFLTLAGLVIGTDQALKFAVKDMPLHHEYLDYNKGGQLVNLNKRAKVRLRARLFLVNGRRGSVCIWRNIEVGLFYCFFGAVLFLCSFFKLHYLLAAYSGLAAGGCISKAIDLFRKAEVIHTFMYKENYSKFVAFSFADMFLPTKVALILCFKLAPLWQDLKINLLRKFRTPSICKKFLDGGATVSNIENPLRPDIIETLREINQARLQSSPILEVFIARMLPDYKASARRYIDKIMQEQAADLPLEIVEVLVLLEVAAEQIRKRHKIQAEAIQYAKFIEEIISAYIFSINSIITQYKQTVRNRSDLAALEKAKKVITNYIEFLDGVILLPISNKKEYLSKVVLLAAYYFCLIDMAFLYDFILSREERVEIDFVQKKLEEDVSWPSYSQEENLILYLGGVCKELRNLGAEDIKHLDSIKKLAEWLIGLIRYAKMIDNKRERGKILPAAIADKISDSPVTSVPGFELKYGTTDFYIFAVRQKALTDLIDPYSERVDPKEIPEILVNAVEGWFNNTKTESKQALIATMAKQGLSEEELNGMEFDRFRQVFIDVVKYCREEETRINLQRLACAFLRDLVTKNIRYFIGSDLIENCLTFAFTNCYGYVLWVVALARFFEINAKMVYLPHAKGYLEWQDAGKRRRDLFGYHFGVIVNITGAWDFLDDLVTYWYKENFPDVVDRINLYKVMIFFDGKPLYIKCTELGDYDPDKVSGVDSDEKLLLDFWVSYVSERFITRLSDKRIPEPEQMKMKKEGISLAEEMYKMVFEDHPFIIDFCLYMADYVDIKCSDIALVLPYLNRAKELDEDNPRVWGHFAKKYALKTKDWNTVLRYGLKAFECGWRDEILDNLACYYSYQAKRMIASDRLDSALLKKYLTAIKDEILVFFHGKEGADDFIPHIFGQEDASPAAVVEIRVLIADDEKDQREWVKDVLLKIESVNGRPIRFSFGECDNGESAYDEFKEQLSKSPYHIVISDMCMPRKVGNKLAEEIYELVQPKGKRYYMILMSSDSLGRLARAYHQRGILDYFILKKPYDKDKEKYWLQTVVKLVIKKLFENEIISSPLEYTAFESLDEVLLNVSQHMIAIETGDCLTPENFDSKLDEWRCRIIKLKFLNEDFLKRLLVTAVSDGCFSSLAQYVFNRILDKATVALEEKINSIVEQLSKLPELSKKFNEVLTDEDIDAFVDTNQRLIFYTVAKFQNRQRCSQPLEIIEKVKDCFKEHRQEFKPWLGNKKLFLVLIIQRVVDQEKQEYKKEKKEREDIESKPCPCESIYGQIYHMTLRKCAEEFYGRDGKIRWKMLIMRLDGDSDKEIVEHFNYQWPKHKQLINSKIIHALDRVHIKIGVAKNRKEIAEQKRITKKTRKEIYPLLRGEKTEMGRI
ncbi:MAG: hypothetical protein JSV34_04865, partial [Candidatus Omnitrophota bacterium]